eukprot:624563-Rhodomonas_salina.1
MKRERKKKGKSTVFVEEDDKGVAVEARVRVAFRVVLKLLRVLHPPKTEGLGLRVGTLDPSQTGTPRQSSRKGQALLLELSDEFHRTAETEDREKDQIYVADQKGDRTMDRG